MAKTNNQKIDKATVDESQYIEDEIASASADGELKQFESQIAGLEDQLKRALADYRNLERRVSEDSLAIVNYSRSQFLLKFLPILDHLNQAVAGAEQQGESSGWLTGVKMALKQMLQILNEEGLEVITGDTFDPNIHEAVDTAEGDEGKILKILQNGYMLNGKVIKPAKVVVGKSSDKIDEGGK